MALLLVSMRIHPRCPPLQRRKFYLAPLLCKEQTSRPNAARRFSARPQPSQEENTEPAPFSPPLRRSHHRDNEILSLSSDAHAGPNLSERPKIGRLVLVRHGQSEWNVTDPTRNLTARFVSLTWNDITYSSQFTTLSYSLCVDLLMLGNKRLDGPILGLLSRGKIRL